MFLSMMKFDFVAAFNYNPVMFVIFWIWNIIGVLGIIDKIEFVKKPKFLYTVLALSLASYFIFSVVRFVQHFPDFMDRVNNVTQLGEEILTKFLG